MCRREGREGWGYSLEPLIFIPQLVAKQSCQAILRKVHMVKQAIPIEKGSQYEVRDMAASPESHNSRGIRTGGERPLNARYTLVQPPLKSSFVLEH